MFVARHIYEAGEDNLADLVLDLRDEWPAGTSFPIELTGKEETKIRQAVKRPNKAQRF